jgi:hypothetical protein
MELPRHTGAGPETTGIDEQDEQLTLFNETEQVGGVEVRSSDAAIGGLRHLHALRYRPDRLRAREHRGVRGDRLGVTCWHEGYVVRWRPRSG